jgi:hypothetical protein
MALGTQLVSSTPIDYVVTVPAIWSESAKAKTKKAAEEAGFKGSNALYVVTEPVSIISPTHRTTPLLQSCSSVLI